jgi:hypothetical protein
MKIYVESKDCEGENVLCVAQLAGSWHDNMVKQAMMREAAGDGYDMYAIMRRSDFTLHLVSKPQTLVAGGSATTVTPQMLLSDFVSFRAVKQASLREVDYMH